MADEIPRNRLGRGLAALLGEAAGETSAAVDANMRRMAAIELVRPNPNNPRRMFDEAALSDLADSIREKGILQPILVRPIAALDGAFEIIAGERRWRAAQRAGLHEVPILSVQASDAEALEYAIIENVQRSDLNAVEEARGYDRLIQSFGYTQADVARVVGRSRPHVANTLRLLSLPDELRTYVEQGALSAGHARALLSAKDPKRLADKVISEGLSVREVERLVADAAAAPETKSATKQQKDADTRALEKALEDVLGLRVSIDHGAKGGSLSIQYKTSLRQSMEKEHCSFDTPR
jgi:ParB family transcriptional regulator, chromosome partitioning protein